MQRENRLILNTDLGLYTGLSEPSQTNVEFRKFTNSANLVEVLVPFDSSYTFYGIAQPKSDLRNHRDVDRHRGVYAGQESIDGITFNVWHFTPQAMALSSVTAKKLQFVAEFMQITDERFLGTEYVPVGSTVDAWLKSRYAEAVDTNIVRVVSEDTDYQFNGTDWIALAEKESVLFYTNKSDVFEWNLEENNDAGFPDHDPTTTELIFDELDDRITLTYLQTYYYTKIDSDSRYLPLDGSLPMAGDIDMGGNDILNVSNITPTSITFDTDKVLSWSDTNGTLELTLSDGVTVQLGQENLVYVRNTSGVLLTEGQPVRLSGTLGNRPEAFPVDIANDTHAQTTIGLVTSAGGIANNAFGHVATFGLVRELNTSAYAVGDILWVNPSGGLTNNRADIVAPNNVIKIGYVVTSSATNGVIFVCLDRLQKLNELSDVFGTPSDEDIVMYDSVNGRFFYFDLKGYVDTRVEDLVKSASYNSVNGVLTFTRDNDTTFTIDLPLEQLIVSGEYDEINKDLILTLDNGSTITIPVDDIFTGLATQTWVNTQLENYYTQAQVDTIAQAKIDLDLGNTSVVTDMVSTDLFYVYRPSDGTYKRISFSALLGDITTETGSFSPIATYEDLTAGFAYQKIADAIPYGEVEIPDDFTPTVPFKFYRDWDNVVKHNIDFTQYYIGTKIYVDLENGNDTTGDGSLSTPYKTVAKSFNVINASADGEYEIIVISDKIFFRGEFWASNITSFTNKQITVRQTDGKEMIVTTAQSGLSWTLDGTGTYKATRSAVRGVYDIDYVDFIGNNIPYQNVSTLLECQNTQGTFYTDGVNVWVHRIDELEPTDLTTFVNIEVTQFNPSILTGSRIYLENARFLSSTSQAVSLIGETTGVTEGEFIGNKCKFIGSYGLLGGSSGNAFSTNNIGFVYLFNSFAVYALKDGFNYRSPDITNSKECLIIEFNCMTYDNGNNATDDINNSSTAHNGISILRIGTIAYNSKGAVLADVDSCYSICVDCRVRDSSSTVNSIAYRFDLVDTGFGVGKARLINCDAGGDITYDLVVDGTTYLTAFKGNRINGFSNIVWKE